MKNLHDANLDITAYIWYFLKGRGRPANGGLEHLYATPRGTPPPIGEDRNRRWWMPYQTWAEWPTSTPLCGGGFQTRARRPLLITGAGINRCPDCLAIADRRHLTHNTYWFIYQNDPWSLLDYRARATTPDPVTGL